MSEHAGETEPTLPSVEPGPPPIAPPPPSAPPTVPGQLRAPNREPSWPTAIGIIMIVLSIGSLVSSIWYVVIFAFFRGQTFGAMWASQISVVGGLYVVAAGLGALLLVAAIFLLMRRAWTRPTLLLWAIGKILVSIAIAVATSEPYLQASGPGSTWMLVFQIVPVLWAIALPVFTLIWFTRRGVVETMRGWKTRAAATFS
jgi:hypothetical protein